MKVIPEKIIENCWQCNLISVRNCPCSPLKPVPQVIPNDCPLKDAPEWKDKPDSEGWWWFYGECDNGKFGTLPLPFLFIKTSKGLIEPNDEYWLKKNFVGKWIKAIVPVEEK